MYLPFLCHSFSLFSQSLLFISFYQPTSSHFVASVYLLFIVDVYFLYLTILVTLSNLSSLYTCTYCTWLFQTNFIFLFFLFSPVFWIKSSAFILTKFGKLIFLSFFINRSTCSLLSSVSNLLRLSSPCPSNLLFWSRYLFRFFPFQNAISSIHHNWLYRRKRNRERERVRWV